MVRNRQQPAQVGLGLGQDRVHGRRPVTDLENRRTGAGIGEQVALDLAQDVERQHRRARREVVDAVASLVAGAFPLAPRGTLDD